VWTDRAQFERLAADYGAAATRLAELAQAGDKAAAAAQWDAVSNACEVCHEPFRSESAPAR
jgi:cytochrome c556